MSDDTRPITETLDGQPCSVELLTDCPSGKGTRRFSMLAYTGAPVDRLYGKFVIDLAGIQLKQKLAMLVDHDGSKIAGFADKFAITDRGLELEGVLSSHTPHGQTVAALSDEGFPWEASVGIEVLEREEVPAGESCEVNGIQFEGPISVARACVLRETSFLYSGADSNTYAVALSSITEKEAPVADPKENFKEELAAFRAEFPGHEELATQAFLDGKTKVDLQLELAAKDREELVAARATIETLTAELDKAREELDTIKKLEAQAGNPGVGFDQQAREALKGDRPSSLPQNPKEAWERSERLQAEFPTLAAYEALCRREGFNPKEAL